MTFGTRLTGHRTRLGLTQERLAERARLGVRTIRDLERGRVARPRSSSITLLADALELRGRERAEFVASALGAPTPLTVAAGRMPPVPDAFCGRDGDVRELVPLVRAGTPLLLHGPAGVGKTALAARIAAALTLACPGGQLYVDLRGATRPLTRAAALRSLLADLGADTGGSEEPLVRRYRDATTGRRLLVLLDNAADETQVRGLLPGRGSLTVLTSRRLLMLGEAVPHRVGALGIPAAATLLGRLTGTDEAADAERVAAACGRTPLSIGLAASLAHRHPLWTLRDLAVRLESRADRDRAAVALAYESLSPAAARTLRLLAAADADPVPARMIADPTGPSEVEGAVALADLLDSGLVVEPGSGACRVPDTVRGYLGARFRGAPDDAYVRLNAAACRADLALDAGRVDEALGLYARARNAALRLGAHAVRLRGDVGIATVRARLGSAGEAAERFRRVLGDPYLMVDEGLKTLVLKAFAAVRGDGDLFSSRAGYDAVSPARRPARPPARPRPRWTGSGRCGPPPRA